VNIPPDLDQLWKHGLDARLKDRIPIFEGAESADEEKKKEPSWFHEGVTTWWADLAVKRDADPMPAAIGIQRR